MTMRVILSGFNVDTTCLTEYQKRAKEIGGMVAGKDVSGIAGSFFDDISTLKGLTPETFPAAYARISRDPRGVDELRHEAVLEVEKARKLNEAIIFDMGHSSVAEHAVFNLDIIGISRLAAEELQRTRLASYTEKSQRYITLTDDYIISNEVKDSGFKDEFRDTVSSLNSVYHTLYKRLLPLMQRNHPDLTRNRKGETILDGWAKEDARYVVPLTTTTQMGMTANARVLEMTIRRLSASRLTEVRELSKKIYDAVFPMAPSVIKYTMGTPYDTETQGLISNTIAIPEGSRRTDKKNPITLIDHTEDGDDRLAAALIFSNTGLDYPTSLEAVRGMAHDEKKNLIFTSFSHMESYDRVLREFETIELKFEAVLSASCFGQPRSPPG